MILCDVIAGETGSSVPPMARGPVFGRFLHPSNPPLHTTGDDSLWLIADSCVCGGCGLLLYSIVCKRRMLGMVVRGMGRSLNICTHAGEERFFGSSG